jgi:hypothetical protein
MVAEISHQTGKTTDGGNEVKQLPPKPGLFAEVMGDAQKGVNLALNDTGKIAESNAMLANRKIDFEQTSNPYQGLDAGALQNRERSMVGAGSWNGGLPDVNQVLQETDSRVFQHV